MLPESIKAEIFKSIPKTITIGADVLNIHVDYTDKIENISLQLQTTPVVITLKYFGDHRNTRESPVNDLMGIDNDGTDSIVTRGERELISLSISVNSVKYEATDFHHRGETAEAVVNQLLLWFLRDLPEVDGIATRERSDVSDLSFTMDDSVERRHVDIFLTYSFTYDKTENTIETINETVDVQQE